MALNRAGYRLGLGAALMLAALARLAVMAPAVGKPPDDPDHYLILARSLAGGQGFALNGRPTAYRPPLYPLMLAPVAAICGDRPTPGVFALHLALGLGTVALTALSARRWGLSPSAGLVAGFLVALDPVLLGQSRSVMTETPAAFLVAATLAALAGPRGPWLGGAGLGLLTLCRPSFLPAAALVTAVAALAKPPAASRSRLIRALAIGAATAATLTPWAVRNARVFGEPVWTTTHGGYTLALANNPVYYEEVLDGPPGAVWGGPGQERWWAQVARETAGMTEPRADRALARSALRLAADRPGAFARASLARLGRFWGLAPTSAVYPAPVRIATALWTAPLWIALALGLARPEVRRWPEIAAPALILALGAVHAFFWSDMRMRAPLIPAIALIAAAGSVPWIGLAGRRMARADRPERGPGKPPDGVAGKS